MHANSQATKKYAPINTVQLTITWYKCVYF